VAKIQKEYLTNNILAIFLFIFMNNSVIVFFDEKRVNKSKIKEAIISNIPPSL
jgi:hypothetical protein